MTDNGDFPPINLETGNWPPLSDWTGPASDWWLLRWILWDPYSLRTYADRYVREESERHSLTSDRARAAFLGDVARLILRIWLLLNLIFIILSMWWLSSLTLLCNVIGSGFLCLFVSGSFLLILGRDVRDPAIASIWAFVSGASATILYWSEIAFREGTPELGILLYWVFVATFGLLMGVVINSVLHGMMRRGASLASMIRVKRFCVFFYICGLAIYVIMLENLILHDWISFTISIGPLAIGLLLSLLVSLMGCRRVDDWLWGLGIPQKPSPSEFWRAPRVTTVPPPRVRSNLERWFMDGRRAAVSNINQFWRFTNLRSAMYVLMAAIIDASGDNDTVIQNVSSLERRQYEWRLTDLFPDIVAAEGSWRTRLLRWRARRTGADETPNPYIRYAQDFAIVGDGPQRVKTGGFGSRSSRAAAGFAQMERWRFDEAARIFDTIRDADSAAELAQLARTLQELALADPEEKKFVQVKRRLESPMYPLLPQFPSVQNRGDVWWVIEQLNEGLFYLWLRRRTPSPPSQSELVSAARDRFGVVDDANLLEPDASLLKAIATCWRYELTVSVGNEEVISPPRVSNPYRTDRGRPGDPSYVVRDELRLVQRALDCRPDSTLIVLNGLPGIGVTTLLADLKARSPIARLSLGRLADQADAGENLVWLLMEEIARLTNRSAPACIGSANDWRQALMDCMFDALDILDGQLTIAVDDLDRAEALPRGRTSLEEALAFIATSAQGDIEGLSLVMAGHFTPAEVVGLPWDRFISLRLFDQEESSALLENPIPGRTLFYLAETLAEIQARTGGHPCLVRLMGEGLIDRYNRLEPRDPVFSIRDVNAVSQDPTSQRLSFQNSAQQKRAERMIYRPIMQTVQRMGGFTDALLDEIARYPNSRTDDDLASLMARQYDASAEQVQRTLDDLDKLGLIARGESDSGQEIWRMTIPLFQDYLRSR